MPRVWAAWTKATGLGADPNLVPSGISGNILGS